MKCEMTYGSSNVRHVDWRDEMLLHDCGCAGPVAQGSQ